jgi:hypothetical protein
VFTGNKNNFLGMDLAYQAANLKQTCTQPFIQATVRCLCENTFDRVHFPFSLSLPPHISQCLLHLTIMQHLVHHRANGAQLHLGPRLGKKEGQMIGTRR